MDTNINELISRVRNHFKTHRYVLDMLSILKDIPFIIWWIKDLDGNILDCSNGLQWFLDNLTLEQIEAFESICHTSDKYSLCSYNVDGTRRPGVFYEILEIPDCDIKGIWKVTKMAIPVTEEDDNKCNIFSIAYMQDKMYGSFEEARMRLKLLEDNNLVTKLSDNTFINKSRGHY